eukprot:840222_1
MYCCQHIKNSNLYDLLWNQIDFIGRKSRTVGACSCIHTIVHKHPKLSYFNAVLINVEKESLNNIDYSFVGPFTSDTLQCIVLYGFESFVHVLLSSKNLFELNTMNIFESKL